MKNVTNDSLLELIKKNTDYINESKQRREAIKFVAFINDYNSKRTISEYVNENQKIVGIYDRVKPNIDVILNNQDNNQYQK